MALRLAGGSREGDPTPQGAGAIPLCPRTSSIFSFDFSSFSSSMVLWPCRHYPLLQLFVMLLLRCSDSSTFPLNFRDSLIWVLPWGKSSNVIVKVLYLACHMLRLRLRLRLLFRDRIRFRVSVSSSCSFRDSMIESRRSRDLLHNHPTPPPPPHPPMF